MAPNLSIIRPEEYKAVAARLRSKARFEEDRNLASEWMRLALLYGRLADETAPNPAEV